MQTIRGVVCVFALPALFLGAAACAELQEAVEAVEPTVQATSGDTAIPAPSATEVIESGDPTSVEIPAGPALITAEASWIFDGDSFDATGPDGRFEVRLLGINANESTECLGDVARDRLIELIGREQVELQIEGFDEFGRELAYVFHDGVLINELLLSEGLAVARSAFGHDRQASFDAVEAVAVEAELGLWSPEACGPADSSGVIIAGVKFDADGPDNENPNDEWIMLENTSDSVVSLTGWTVRDESTRHRYVFAAGTELEPGQRIRLRSGCGTDGGEDRFWCNEFGTVWSNSGDTAFVLNASGATVDQFAWQSIYGE